MGNVFASLFAMISTMFNAGTKAAIMVDNTMQAGVNLTNVAVTYTETLNEEQQAILANRKAEREAIVANASNASLARLTQTI